MVSLRSLALTLLVVPIVTLVVQAVFLSEVVTPSMIRIPIVPVTVSPPLQLLQLLSDVPLEIPVGLPGRQVHEVQFLNDPALLLHQKDVQSREDLATLPFPV